MKKTSVHLEWTWKKGEWDADEPSGTTNLEKGVFSRTERRKETLCWINKVN
jgi:hypothetical protein